MVLTVHVQCKYNISGDCLVDCFKAVFTDCPIHKGTIKRIKNYIE